MLRKSLLYKKLNYLLTRITFNQWQRHTSGSKQITGFLMLESYQYDYLSGTLFSDNLRADALQSVNINLNSIMNLHLRASKVPPFACRDPMGQGMVFFPHC